MTVPCLRPTEAGVEILLYVQPRSSRNRVVGLQGGELKIALTAPPVEGAANKACGDFLARLFNLPKRCVRLTSGDTSRHKRWLLEGCDAREVSRLLNEQLGG